MTSETFYVVQYYDPRGAWRECTQPYETQKQAKDYIIKETNFAEWKIVKRTDKLMERSPEIQPLEKLLGSF